jgi:hypothetical protein
MSAVYHYLFATLAASPRPHEAFARDVFAFAQGRGGEPLAAFAPQLGWAADEAAALVRWPAEPVPDAGAIVGNGVGPLRADLMTPTLRPADDARVREGGIYVHRWFEVAQEHVEEFLALSAEGWSRFETLFDAQIFGLLRAKTPAEASGDARLLLLTRYKDHGVWEASRDPSTEAMQICLRRRQLPRRTWAASSRPVLG